MHRHTLQRDPAEVRAMAPSSIPMLPLRKNSCAADAGRIFGPRLIERAEFARDRLRAVLPHHFAVARSLFAEFAVSEITHGQVIKNVRLAWRQISHLRGWRERGQFAVFEHGVDRAVCLLDQR